MGPRTRAKFKSATGVERVVVLRFKPGCSAPLLGVAAIITLMALPVIKGAVVGLLYAVNVNRVWGEYMTPFGQLRFGRMPNQWGLGMVDNAGDGIDSDYQSTIDRIPLPDASVDCVISNCVLNLAPDKPAVFREITRVLKPGGRLAVSDIALKGELPEAIARSMAAYVGCIAGAIRIDDYRAGLLAAGFEHVEIVDSGSDLNAYAKVENQSGCCSPAMAESSCCSPAPDTGSATLHAELSDLLSKYDVNAAAASVKVYAIKPKSGTAGTPAEPCCAPGCCS